MSDYRFNDAHLTDFKAVSTEDDGSILIRGIAANYDLDREDESFEEGAFSRGLDRFVNGPATLLFHHKYEAPVGRVLSAKAIPGVGIEVTARVDHQEPGSPWRHVFNGVRSRAISSFSFGGVFKRSGNKIVDVDIVELSICGPSVGRGTEFSILAGKALSEGNMSKTDELAALREQVSTMTKSLKELKGTTPAGFVVKPARAEGMRPGAEDFLAPQSTARKGMTELQKIDLEKAWSERRTQLNREQNQKIREADDYGVPYQAKPIPLAAPDWFVNEWRGPLEVVRELVEGSPAGPARQTIEPTAEDIFNPNNPSLAQKAKNALLGTGSRLAPMANGTMAAVDTGAVTHRQLPTEDTYVTRLRRVERPLTPEEQLAIFAAENETKKEN